MLAGFSSGPEQTGVYQEKVVDWEERSPDAPPLPAALLKYCGSCEESNIPEPAQRLLRGPWTLRAPVFVRGIDWLQTGQDAREADT